MPGGGSDTLSAIAAPANRSVVTDAEDPADWTINPMKVYAYPYPTGGSISFGSAFPYLNYKENRTGGPVANHLINGSGTANKWCYQNDSTFKSGMVNVGFADGHVKSMNNRQYFSTKITSAG